MTPACICPNAAGDHYSARCPAHGNDLHRIPHLTSSTPPVADTSEEIPKVLAVVEVMFRGKWTHVYDVADWKAESGWSMDFSEPVTQMRVRYLPV